MSENNPVYILENGKQYQVTAKGSLGLLALGHIGLNLWREERSKALISSAKKPIE